MTDLAHLLSGRADRPCTLDPNCLYAAGHTCECTPVEVGRYVLRKREQAWMSAYRNRLSAILDVCYAKWLDALVAEGTSPLLIVGWTRKGAETWHRDRYCKRDRAMGELSPQLYLEGVSQRGGGPRACAGCGQLDADTLAVMAADRHRLQEARRDATEGLCWNAHYADCGADVVAGTIACEKHAKGLTEACLNQRHEECDKVLRVNTRTDGSTFTTDCHCVRCDHPGAKTKI